MTRTNVKCLGKPSLLMLCAVVLSLTAFNAIEAKSRPFSTVKTSATTRDPTSDGMNTHVAKRAFLRILRDKIKTDAKFAKSLSANCNCAVAATAAASFSSCLKGCLTSSGVNPMSAAACAAVCSSNLIGCAICAGVGEWVLAACVQYCAWYSVFKVSEARQVHPFKTRGLRRGRLLLKPAAVSS